MIDEVCRLRLAENCLGHAIVADIARFPCGIHVSVYGGALPHIGAVSVASPDGAVSTTEFPGHRDAAVTEGWARALCEKGMLPAVVEAGIHYDGLTREGIREVLETTDRLLAQLWEVL